MGLTGMLVGVAGADRRILHRTPGDRVKHAGMGGVLLTTAGLAAVSSGLALSMALHLPWWAAVGGGLVWGVVILNLDRWLVTSTPRHGSFLPTMVVTVGRLALAVIIGLVVSVPLTLHIFQSEIAAELLRMHADDQAAFERRMLADPRFTPLPEWRQQVVALKAQVAAGPPADAVVTHPDVVAAQAEYDRVTAQYDAAEQAVACEKDGTCGSGRVGAGPAFEEKKARRDRLAAERRAAERGLAQTEQRVQRTVGASAATRTRDLQQQIADLEQRVTSGERGRAAEVKAHDLGVAADDGILARLEALGRLERDKDEMVLAHRGLLIFLTAMEVLPILFKTFLRFMPASAYDRLTKAEEDHLVAQAELEVDLRRWEQEHAARLRLETVQARARTQMDAETAAATAVFAAQMSLVRRSLKRWRQAQAAEIDARVARDGADAILAVPAQPAAGSGRRRVEA